MLTAVKLIAVVLAIAVVALLAAWLYLRAPDIPYATLEARYSGTGSAFVDLPGGIHLHYRDAGNAAGPVLVLLHGFGDSCTSWEQWLPVLARDYRVISLDLPGHGLTRAPDGYQATGPGYVDVLESFADTLATPRFALAGNSMGGGVAWQYALRHPERLTGLVLVDAAGWPLPPPGDLPIAFRLLQFRLGRWALSQIDNRPLIAQGLKADVYDRAVITPAFIDRWAELQRAPGHRAILMSAALASFGMATAQLLGTVRVPTLVLHGESDPLIGIESGRRFARAIPGAMLIAYPEVGHLPQIEIPERSARDVGAFLAAHRAP
jgi:pimeloyl-ACP methyl ester carboxylesterase